MIQHTETLVPGCFGDMTCRSIDTLTHPYGENQKTMHRGALVFELNRASRQRDVGGRSLTAERLRKVGGR